ncbi:MAG: hypothetical protein AAFQ94_09875 [Bacteroidota bacterium]
MDEQKQQEYIESYLNGELDAAEIADFEKRLASDPDLQETVIIAKEMIQGIKGTILRQEIARIHEEEKQTILEPVISTEKPVRKLYWSYGIAASISVLLLLWVGLFNNTTDQELFTEYYEQYPNIVSLRGDDQGTLVAGMKYYAAGDYEKAITLLEKESNASQKNKADRQFYLSLSYLSTEQSELAVRSLEKLNAAETKYQQQIKWYLALAYLQQGERDDALSMLKKIQSGEYQYSQSQEIISEIE